MKIVQITEFELKDILAQERQKTIEKVVETFNNISGFSKQSDLLSRDDTCKYFGISKPCLHDWTRKGILKSYKVGGRVFYKRKEIESLTIKKGA
jgi:hypothetical protein